MLGGVATMAPRVGLLAVLTALPGCRCSDPDPAPRHADWYEVACRSACATYFDSCPARGGRASDRAECQEACEKQSALAARAGCEALRQAFLDCVSRTTLICEAVLSAPAVALSLGEGAPACGAAHSALRACDAPCRDPGTIHLAERPEEQSFVELVRNGCEGCPEKLTGGAPEGSPCQAARVCAQHCCGCEGGPVSYLARACLDGRCADREAACREAPIVSAVHPCAR
jgi:hypothetical protein